MKYETIKEIKQLYNQEDVNHYLNTGYKLLKILSTRIKQDDLDEVKPCYILGKNGDA